MAQRFEQLNRCPPIEVIFHPGELNSKCAMLAGLPAIAAPEDVPLGWIGVRAPMPRRKSKRLGERVEIESGPCPRCGSESVSRKDLPKKLLNGLWSYSFGCNNCHRRWTIRATRDGEIVEDGEQVA
jgi:transcription elongation factor Elf1